MKPLSPAFCLNKSKVLFVEKDSSSNVCFTPTIIDDDIKLNIDTSNLFYKSITADGNEVEIPFSITGKDKGIVDHLSVMAIDNTNSVVYYQPVEEFTGKVPEQGSFLLNTAIVYKSGKLLTFGKDYKFYVFAEKINGEHFTDYASNMVEIKGIHTLDYSSSGNSITAKCKDANCNFSKNITLNAPSNIKYDGTDKKAVVSDYDKHVFPNEYTIIYHENTLDGNVTKDTSVPGKYVAELKYKMNSSAYLTCSAEFTIDKADPTITNYPSGENLKENGDEQKLVNAGTSQNGTIKYALGTDDKTAPAIDKFTTSIPTGKNAGTYYVWYMVEGNTNYSNIDAQCIVTTIASKDEVHKHSLKKIEAKAATATTAGNTEYYYCEGCNTYFEDAAGTKVMAPNSWIIPATGAAEDKTHVHKLAHTPAKAATATETGNIEYWTCTECGKFFSDADGKNEIQKDKLIIAATGKTEPDSPEPGNTATPAAKGKTISDSTASFVVTSNDAKNPTVAISKTNSTKATTIKVPATVKINGVTYKITEVGKNAFKNNKKATKVVLNKNITKIGAGAFYGCANLESVSGASNVTSIGANAFNGCVKLKAAPVGSKVTSIGDKAFYNCKAIKNFTIPVNVNKLGKLFAYGTKNVKTLTVKSKKLTSKNVKAGAYKGLGSSKTVVKVPKGTKKTNTKLFQSKGLNKKIKIQESK